MMKLFAKLKAFPLFGTKQEGLLIRPVRTRQQLLSSRGFSSSPKVRRVVVIEGVRGHAVVELLLVVEPLRAEVVDEVVALVLLLKKTLDVIQRVSVKNGIKIKNPI